MRTIFELVGMVVTIIGVGIGLRAIAAAVRPKPRQQRLRMQPLASSGPMVRSHRRRQQRRHATDPVEEVISLLFQVPSYLLAVVRAAHRNAGELHQHYVTARMPRLEKLAAEAAETPRNVFETPETRDEKPAAPLASDIVATTIVAAPVIDVEAVQLQLIAKLVKAQVIKSETRALEVTFEVNAGGGKEYQRLKARLKEALGETAVAEPSVAFAQSVPVRETKQRITKAA